MVPGSQRGCFRTNSGVIPPAVAGCRIELTAPKSTAAQRHRETTSAQSQVLNSSSGSRRAVLGRLVSVRGICSDQTHSWLTILRQPVDSEPDRKYGNRLLDSIGYRPILSKPL